MPTKQLSSAKLDRYRQQLELWLARARADAHAVVEQTLSPSGGQAGGALSNAPFHLGDAGTDEFLHDMSAALAENEQYLVVEIQDALRRLDDGVYGQCEACGESIGAERLSAMPYVRFCITCADKNGGGLDVNLNTGRPRTPADTIAPEGAMQESWRASRGPLAESNGRHVAAVDRHATGEPGGGSAIGGLAGTNVGHGDPTLTDLQDAAANSEYDEREDRTPPDTPRSGRSGGAVGGTPARKRAK